MMDFLNTTLNLPTDFKLQKGISKPPPLDVVKTINRNLGLLLILQIPVTLKDGTEQSGIIKINEIA